MSTEGADTTAKILAIAALIFALGYVLRGLPPLIEVLK